MAKARKVKKGFTKNHKNKIKRNKLVAKNIEVMSDFKWASGTII